VNLACEIPKFLCLYR